MRANPLPRMSHAEYLAFERGSSEKHEYRAGEIVAMAGARRAHNVIAANIGGLLWQHVRGKDCETYPSDMRVYLPADDLYAYPDLVVVCGEPQFQDEVFDTLLNPTVVIEILSRTTEAYDRGDKAHAYRTIDGLAEYVLVSQDRKHAEKYTRHGDGFWLLSEADGDDANIHLDSIDCTLALSDIYDKVVFKTETAE